MAFPMSAVASFVTLCTSWSSLIILPIRPVSPFSHDASRGQQHGEEEAERGGEENGEQEKDEETRSRAEQSQGRKIRRDAELRRGRVSEHKKVFEIKSN